MTTQIIENDKIIDVVKKFEKINVKVNILTAIDNNYLSHYWYGGDVIELVVNEDITLFIVANGDVVATLYEDDREVVYVKDKNNAGSFFWEMSDYIKNDEELYSLINAEGSTYLQIHNNNWWEVFAHCRGTFIDMMYVLDSDLLNEAMEEVYESLDEILHYLKPIVEKVKEEEKWIQENVKVGNKFKCVNSNSVFKEIGEIYTIVSIKDKEVHLENKNQTTDSVSIDVFKYFYEPIA